MPFKQALMVINPLCSKNTVNQEPIGSVTPKDNGRQCIPPFGKEALSKDKVLIFSILYFIFVVVIELQIYC
ncbi:hypothetical protein DTW91_07955 [Chryseobacterium sp. SC28]|nr:hypothetical protein DTW91_07955 [Chryseobacterium sp. SC28]